MEVSLVQLQGRVQITPLTLALSQEPACHSHLQGLPQPLVQSQCSLILRYGFIKQTWWGDQQIYVNYFF